ncbi:DUF3830 family protein [Candidatus Atribacteria bacterium MT.SAG.1]|nr:DUF3830 family protein [Candidatus Atribacteria bacterium MT.SAG.1]
MRKIKITFVEENVSAVAVLLDEKAPKTCDMIWKLLESPVENYGVHAKWTGAEISFGIPADRLPQKSGFVPPENQTVIPIPGDLIWNAYEPYQWLGNPLPVYDFGIFYERESRLFLPGGWRPSNRFGEIRENLEEFAIMCARCQTEGKKLIKLEKII